MVERSCEMPCIRESGCWSVSRMPKGFSSAGKLGLRRRKPRTIDRLRQTSSPKDITCCVESAMVKSISQWKKRMWRPWRKGYIYVMMYVILPPPRSHRHHYLRSNNICTRTSQTYIHVCMFMGNTFHRRCFFPARIYQLRRP